MPFFKCNCAIYIVTGIEDHSARKPRSIQIEWPEAKPLNLLMTIKRVM